MQAAMTDDRISVSCTVGMDQNMIYPIKVKIFERNCYVAS